MTEKRWGILCQGIGFFVIVVLGVGLTLPSMTTPIEATRRSEAQNDLKQIGLAIINYAAEDGSISPVAIVDKDGNPLLSWRVLLLPQFDQSDLYKQFDLTKAWDSPENLPLVQKMPDVLGSPRDPESAKAGTTPYKAIVSESDTLSTAWGKPGQRMSLSKFKDGMSNTVMVVEDLTDPVIWTKPEDITPSQYLKTLDHGQWSSKTFLIQFADGSVRGFIDPTEEEILPLLYADDGKVAE